MIDTTGFRFGKGDPRAKVKARADRQWDKQREINRAHCYHRDGGRCLRCGRRLVLRPSDARSFLEIANINEEPKRSRGGDPLSPVDCGTFCGECHPLLTDNRIEVVFQDPVRKFEAGPESISFKQKEGKRYAIRSLSGTRTGLD